MNLYAPLATDAEIRAAHDTSIEPGHYPHFKLSQAPITAEAATEVGADDEGDRSRDLPEGAGLIISAAIGGTIAAVAMAWHMWAGFFQ